MDLTICREFTRTDVHGLTRKQISALVDEIDTELFGEEAKGKLTAVEIKVTVTRKGEA